MKSRLILASASPRRARLSQELGFEFEIIPSAAEEVHYDYLTARELCRINAHRKAREVARRFPDAVVLGMDTLVALGAVVFGKPANLGEARRMLERLQGKTHQVLTGVCVLHLRAHREVLFVEQTDVTFHPLTAEQIERYHARVSPLDKAGAYGIQEEGDQIVAGIDGSYSNVVGLPLERLRAELDDFLGGAGRSL